MMIWLLVTIITYNMRIINVSRNVFFFFLFDILPNQIFISMKVGKLKPACQAVASYLLFYPEDLDMKRNLQFYKSLSEVNDSFFTPREVETNL